MVVVVSSFFHFIDLSGRDAAKAQCDRVSRSDVPAEFRADYDRACRALSAGGVNAWDTDFFFPLSTWPAFFAIIIAALTAVAAFSRVALPVGVAGFTLRQLAFGLALSGLLMMVGWLVMGVEQTLWGIGFWLMLAGTTALVVGTAIDLLTAADRPAAIRPGPATSGPPSSF